MIMRATMRTMPGETLDSSDSSGTDWALPEAIARTVLFVRCFMASSRTVTALVAGGGKVIALRAAA